MTASRPAVTRRALLGMAALVPLAGCARGEAPAAPPPAVVAPDHDDHLAGLERKFGARLGVYALATGTGATVAHRADERFAFCSTFKALATAAVLHRNPMSHLDALVTYGEADLMKSSVITRQHVSTGMTIRQLCDAAVRYSDGTAGNLLLRDLGGPAELTAYARGLGDEVTRMDRVEPLIVEATPGDPRDTSSPRAFGTDFDELVLKDALPEDKRAFLRDLLQRGTTGARRIKAAVPPGWTVANKTGTGDYGTLNDIAVVWPPDSAPLVIAIMSSKPAKDAEYDEALLAEAAAHVIATLT
ncbi:beta-lactamase class A [Saccharopolyspora erythraea NRRL 2338]|uniref:Beta-lactamase n=2 Tax=Saccharopolyspora erythraea TaxID=1836 RepID=A4FHM7_SACEN|nr:class A beta-lactamase [Saccharopolyspora erythraea]EQD86794.1 beta-lactamase [Saccharopolyspora erythraea D]PFG97242.1 beta-lactamase class A [Saccharopolyspora erythraea NRRL 2338]QRK87436.1 class A beta-lactamase [Saccharopolyspora erythraea]CAM03552.1 beta-lactamase precursor [Saccharopolyspora erythraea NRRL 2338]